jgi:selenocysteine lyase/cysteine desulfurase
VGSADEVDEVRDLFAKLINARSGDCIALGYSTSFAMTTAVKNLHLSRMIQSGKTIVLVEKEMGSVVYPWQNLCSEIGCKLKVVTKAFGTSWTDSILKAIDNVTAILAIPNVHWCDGSLIDLEVIRAAIDKMHPDKQPQLVVDGTQSIGVMPFDVQKIRPIFVACSVHKWCNAPYGMSLMYLDPAYHRQWLPLDQVLHRAYSLHVYYVVLIMLPIVTFKHERGRVGSDQPAWDEQVC